MSCYAGPTNWWMNYDSLGRYRLATDRIVQSGLALNFDFGTSFGVSGTTITNLANTAHTGAATNGPIVDQDGNMTFDGTNDWIDMGVSQQNLGAVDKTMCAWIYPISYGTGSSIIDQDKDGVGGYGYWLTSAGKLWYWPQGMTDLIDNGSLSAALNQWTYVTIISRIVAKSASFYYNTNFSSTVSGSGTEVAPDATTKLGIAALRNGSSSFFNGKIATVHIYNRVLSVDEITQNFNVTRGRFGI